jgi:GDPmannose 4,6-dehydratase
MLGWQAKTTMQELCRMMVDADMRLAERERTLVAAGHLV